MKRKDIQPLEAYGYSEDRNPYHYSAMLVLSTDLYTTPRFSNRNTELALPGRRMTRGNSYTSRVGMLAVYSFSATHDAIRRLRALVSVEGALEAFTGGGSVEVKDADGADLGRYHMLTSLAYLHGDYFELTRKLEEDKRQEEEKRAERARLDRLDMTTYDGLSERLDALGITGYSRAEWETKHRFEALTFDDMDALLDLAEAGWKSDVEGRKLG